MNKKYSREIKIINKNFHNERIYNTVFPYMKRIISNNFENGLVYGLIPKIYKKKRKREVKIAKGTNDHVRKEK